MTHKFIPESKKAFLYLFTISLFWGISSCNQEEYLQPEKRTILDVVFASGYVSTDEQYNIIAAVDGYIEKVSGEEGMHIPDGFILASIEQDAPKAQLNDAAASYETANFDLNPNSPKIQELDKKITVAEKDLNQNNRLLSSYERLLTTKAVSRLDYENQLLQTEKSKKDLAVLEDSKKDLIRSLELTLTNANNTLIIKKDDIKKYQLLSKGESQILKTFHKEGEFIRRGETFAEMGRGDFIVKLLVEESDINMIKIGQSVQISVNTYQHRLFEGQIVHIYPAFDEEQQSFIVEAKFLEKPAIIYSGTQVQANIIVAEKKDAMVIPSNSLVSDQEVHTKDRGLVPLQLGIRNADWVEVLDGITLEDHIKIPID